MRYIKAFMVSLTPVIITCHFIFWVRDRDRGSLFILLVYSFLLLSCESKFKEEV
jgi:hypothetical protein